MDITIQYMKTTIQKYIKHKNVIRYLTKFPEREFTVLELAREVKTPYATTWRFVQLLDKTGIIFTKKIGNYTICILNKKSPYLAEIEKVLELAVSPQRSAFKKFLGEIKKIKEVSKIYLFGSVAEGKEKPQSDVDVAIITNKKTKEFEEKIHNIMGKTLEDSRIQIVPHVLTEKEFIEDKSFKKEVEKGELSYERNRRSKGMDFGSQSSI
jgi:predicted nucleotidyltransferase